MKSSIKTYDNIVRDIELYCNTLQLSYKIKDEAISIFKRFLLKKSSLQGQQTNIYPASLIWLACKTWRYPLTAKSINNEIGLDTTFAKGETLIMRLGNKIARNIEQGYAPVNVENYIDTIQAKLQSPPEARIRASIIIQYIKDKKLNIGSNNPALASAITYIADRIEGYRVNEREYSNIVGSTEVSLRNYKRRLLNAIPNIKQHKLNYKWKDDENGYTPT